VVAGGGVILLEYQPGPLQPGRYRPFVVNVWCDEEYRRQGLARQLMETMVTWAREQGFAALNLHASEAGRPLYEELGFVRTNEMRLKLSS
jgi:GNAT superfamily N-acetyltransferase